MNFSINSPFFRYAVGFVISLVLTLLVYAAATERWISSPDGSILLLFGLASTQVIVQVVLFLHVLEPGNAPNWKLYSLVFTGAMIVVIVAASIWIMKNLDYNMINMSPEQKSSHMIKENQKGF